METAKTQAGLSQEPINVLFNPSVMAKKNVWEIDLIGILDLLIGILERSGRKDLRVAGMAALSSSLIYRMKVESIFALERAAMDAKKSVRKSDVDIDMIGIPYRHESTYPVTLDELLALLESLIGSMANPRNRRGVRLEPVDPPDFDKYFVSIEDVIAKYESMIMRKIREAGSGLLSDIVKKLDQTDAIRCFFAVLFMARDQKIRVEQDGDDIRVSVAVEDQA